MTRAALPKPTPPPLRERTRATPPPPRFSVASDEECTPLWIRAVAHETEERHAIVPPRQTAPDIDPPPALHSRKWLLPAVLAAALLGAGGALVLLALLVHGGAQTGAVADAIAEQRAAAERSASEQAAPEVVPAGFDAHSAMATVRREARELAAGCGTRQAERVRIAMRFWPSGRVAGADVRDRFGDTFEGRCLERALRDITVAPFSGQRADVEVTVELQPAGPAMRNGR